MALIENLEYMLARRTASAESASRAVVMTRIAVATVALAIAVMILSLAIMTGFRKQVSDCLRGLTADVVVYDISGLMGFEPQRMAHSEQLVELIRGTEGVESVAEYVTLSGMARNGENVVGLQLKGIGAEYDTLWWHSILLEGHLPEVGAEARTKSIALSHTTARELGVSVGDKVELLLVDGAERPRRDRFKVSGIYSSGLEEMERLVALADVRDVRRLIDAPPDEVTGYDVMLAGDVFDRGRERWVDLLTEAVAEWSAEQDGEVSPVAVGIGERYPVVFDWLKAHSVNAVVVIVIMMVVLLFNMSSTLLIMVLDRRGMIGVLKTQGMSGGAIRRMFLYRSAILFGRGALWGNLVGLGLVVVQIVWQPLKLDASGYMISVLPVSLGLGWWLLLNVTVGIVTVAAMVLPTAIVSRITPSESLKYRA